MSWLQSGHHAVSFSPPVAVTVLAEPLRNVHQTLLVLQGGTKGSVTLLS